ncbi:DUF3618 domain-containing protein [Mumia zhuanghuii]|uniref:DUF3618 domain-containing protein n=1 Tax=Mumia zhuanghuii TaxID=2585211 RepID=A0A5C4MIK7_9ACTN|nr:DUF3618 domain-containing protein [Mumia zhuanghuii]TNC39898.1 DUF3618 domain-containing protein [Mumia zhuanghuii]
MTQRGDDVAIEPRPEVPTTITGTPDQLVSQIDEVRNRLASNVDQLVDLTKPKNIARRSIRDVKAHFVTPSGEPRLENILPVAGAVVGVLGLIVVIRKIVSS